MKKKSTKVPIWVIKIGSQLLMDGGPLLIRSLMRETVALTGGSKNSKLRIVWVSSGAIASARRRLNLQWHSIPEKQALSAIGQPLLMDLYNVALQSEGRMGAQVLLSYSDFSRKESRTHLRNTILQLLDWQIVPILNENDAVATDEIQFGDNDQLSAKVAAEMGADRLVILTNVAGVYDRAPEEKGATLLSHIPKLTKEFIRKSAVGTSQMGRGGMATKLLAAEIAWKKKIPTFIAHGEAELVLTRLFQGEALGTSLGARK